MSDSIRINSTGKKIQVNDSGDFITLELKNTTFMSGLIGLRREDFPSEEAFIEAGIERQMRLNNPAYQKARIAVMEEREKQLKEEAARQDQAEYEAAVKACRLSKNQEAEVRKAAAEKAVMDMNDGKIPPNKVSDHLMESRAKRGPGVSMPPASCFNIGCKSGPGSQRPPRIPQVDRCPLCR